MRKFALLAATAALGLSGSMVKADFVISSTRTPGATYDTVNFFVKDTATNTTTGSSQQLNLVDVALYSPSGLLVGTTTASSTRADVFGINSNTQANGSYINFNVPANGFATADGGTPASTSGGSILENNGATYTHVPSTTTGFTSGQLVPGIAGTVYFAGDSIADGLPVQFAQAVVPHGALAEVLNPGTSHLDPTWETAATAFSDQTLGGTVGTIPASNALLSPYVDGVPEPATMGLLGLAVGGLVLRRRPA